MKANRASPQTSFGPRHSIASFFSASLAETTNASRLPSPRSRRSESTCCPICIIRCFFQQHRVVILFATTFLLLQYQNPRASVTVGKGLSSASSSSAIVSGHGGYIDLFAYFHLRKLARLLWPPFLRLAPKSLIRQLSFRKPWTDVGSLVSAPANSFPFYCPAIPAFPQAQVKLRQANYAVSPLALETLHLHMHSTRGRNPPVHTTTRNSPRTSMRKDDPHQPRTTHYPSSFRGESND